MNEQDVQIAELVKETNAATIPDPVAVQLRADLGPVADRVALYTQEAASVQVRNQAEADAAVELAERIATDINLVKRHKLLSKITDGWHKLHRQWTGLRDAFVKPMTESYKTIKGKVIDWQETEWKEAEELQRKLQAEAEEKARKARERLEKEAAKLKTESKREERLAEAAAIVVPVVSVVTPKVTMKGMARVWKVKEVNLDVFYAALATDKSLRGYVAIDQVRMQRAKAANPETDIPGVIFAHELR